MKYSELANAKGVDARQRSLFNILDAACHAATCEGSEPIEIVVIRAPIYVDEFAEGEHVYAPRPAIEAGIIYKNRPGIEWQIDAIVSGRTPTERKEGASVFLTRIEDSLVLLQAVTPSQRRVEMVLLDGAQE